MGVQTGRRAKASGWEQSWGERCKANKMEKRHDTKYDQGGGQAGLSGQITG